MNPFEQNKVNLNNTIRDWSQIKQMPYDKLSTDAFTKTRIILMNGTEFEQNWFLHNFMRHCNNNDLRRDLTFLRRLEQQQQKLLASLKPNDESILETTIGYEQLAVDLTAALAMNEPDKYVKQVLDFALLEDFDHLYRYANLLEMDAGIRAETIVGGYTEIMPARPTISEHRHPFDEVRRCIDSKSSELITKLNVNIITAAEQQTMNYYMNVGQFYGNDLGRSLYTEIAMIEEQHVTEYGSLIDTKCTWLEGLLMHEYVETYLYYSCYMDETDQRIKKIWLQLYEEEVGHLQFATELLKKYEKKDAQEVIACGKFPSLLTFQPNIEYVRNIINNSVTLTADFEDYTNVSNLTKDSRFHSYQSKVNKTINSVASHVVINNHIGEYDSDYRYMTEEHPIKELRGRESDNTTVGRIC